MAEPRPSPTPGRPDAGTPAAEALADRLTEEVAQLLYVVRQDLCELGGVDPELAASARCRTSQAINGLFEVAEALRGRRTGAPLPTTREALRLRALATRTAAQIRLDDAAALGAQSRMARRGIDAARAARRGAAPGDAA